MTKILIGKTVPDNDTLRQNSCPLRRHHFCTVTAFECGYDLSARRPPLWCPLPLTISRESEEDDDAHIPSEESDQQSTQEGEIALSDC